jgi:hypothetical protein
MLSGQVSAAYTNKHQNGAGDARRYRSAILLRTDQSSDLTAHILGSRANDLAPLIGGPWFLGLGDLLNEPWKDAQHQRLGAQNPGIGIPAKTRPPDILVDLSLCIGDQGGEVGFLLPISIGGA